MAESVGVAGFGVSGSFSLTRPTIFSRSSNNISLFRSQSHFPAAAFGSLTRSNPHVHAAVTSDSKAATLLDLTQHDLDNSGDSANGNGDDGGGGGEGGGDNSKGEEGSDGDKRKMALLMSQKFTLAYAALVGGTPLSLPLTFIHSSTDTR